MHRLFNRAEYTYGWKGFRSNEIFAARYIRKILDVCPNAHLMPYLKERLAILEEIKAERNYSVGKFYLKRYRETGKSLVGAQARFLSIIENFPKYSKTETILFLIGETYFFQKKFDKAREYYEKVSRQYPDGEFCKQSAARIAEVKAMDCDTLNAIFIIGAKNKVTQITLTRDMSLLEAIRQAGGTSSESWVKTVSIFSVSPSKKGEREVLTFELKKLREKKVEDPKLKPCDVVDLRSKKATRFRNYISVSCPRRVFY